MSLLRVRNFVTPSWRHARRCLSSTSQEKLQAAYQQRVEHGHLESDQVQKRVVDYLATTLDQAAEASVAPAKKAKEEAEVEASEQSETSEGWAGRPSWVLPTKTLGIGQMSVNEDHRRVAQYTAKLAAENAQRMRSQAGASGRSAGPKVAAVGSRPSKSDAAADGQATAAQVKPVPRRRSSIYMHGPVGTGKTMLLDLFYDHAREAGLRTLRKHFYEFMLGLHRQLHQIREERPVEVAANSLADDIDVLCFDEFQITDVQDAAILPRLFEVLFLRGVAVVMTSNTSPQLLYSGGLNRHVYLPAFVGLLAEHCTVLGLGGPGGRSAVDYRKKAEAKEFASSPDGAASHDAFLFGASAEGRLMTRWEELRVKAGSEAPRDLQLPMGRTLRISRTAGSACLISFQELCGSDRGEADFYALSERFRTVFISGVPRFSSLEDADLVRRFVKLLDLLYDQRVRLVIQAEAAPGELFQEVRDEVGKGDMSDLAWRTALYSADGKAGLNPSAVGTLCEAVRATERAESRLREMRTRRYWDSCQDE